MISEIGWWEEMEPIIMAKKVLVDSAMKERDTGLFVFIFTGCPVLRTSAEF